MQSHKSRFSDMHVIVPAVHILRYSLEYYYSRLYHINWFIRPFSSISHF